MGQLLRRVLFLFLGDDHLSSDAVTDALMRPTRELERAALSVLCLTLLQARFT